MPIRHPRNEDGASLIVVLMFISVFGLIIGGLLTQAGASTRYTNTVSEHEEKVYAADAGVSLGIQQLQKNSAICPSSGSTAVIAGGSTALTVNGRQTKVTCEVTSGSADGALGYSIITRATDANGLTVQSGSAKEISGRVFVTGGDGSVLSPTGLIVHQGDFSQHRGEVNGCTATTTKPSALTLDPGYGYFCVTTAPVDPPNPVPTRPTGVRGALPSADGLCKIFYPGLYLSAPTLDISKTNYFASGVYYFNFGGTFNIAGTGNSTMVVYGGKPASYEDVRYSPMPSCASDSIAISLAGGPLVATEVSGTGVQFAFGGVAPGASMVLDNKSQVELFSRTLDGTEFTRRPTFIAVTSAWQAADPGWVENPLDSTVLSFSSGANKDLLIHGLIFAPRQDVQLYSTNGVDAVVLGGVVAWRVQMQSSNGGGGGGLGVQATNGRTSPRHIIVSATSPDPPPANGEKPVVSTAVIEIANDAVLANGFTRTVTVDSWRTPGPNDPS